MVRREKGGEIVQINELKAGQKSVDIEVEVSSVGEVREFQKYGRQGRVATAVVKDDSGEINLTLWNEDIDNVKEGARIKVENGYVNEFQGEAQLTAGKFGKLIVLE
jgi:replication factor A1